MKVVILAGGMGSRISEESERRPKPMIEVGGMPVLWHIMKIYAHYGLTEFIICLGYKGYVIVEYFANYLLHQSDVTFDLGRNETILHDSTMDGWKVTLARTGEATETGGRLKRVQRYLEPGEAFCMTYGDGVADIDIRALIDYHRKGGFEATLTAVPPPGRFGATQVQDGRVTKFTEKPAAGEGTINGGFFVLEHSVLDRIAGDDVVWEHGPLESLAADGKLGAFIHEGYWQPMDTLRDKRALEEEWRSGRAPWKCWD